MTAKNRLPAPANENDSDDLAELTASIAALVAHFGDLEERARVLGVFLHDRDLLTYPECGLMKDVLIDGRLVT